MAILDFSSDTSAPAHPSILAAMQEVNEGSMASYGGDSETAKLREKIEDIFETKDVFVWPTYSGTSANALALSLFCPPTGSILCHEEAHIQHDERGAPEFFTGGGKLSLLSGKDGQIDESDLGTAIERIDRSFVHETPPHVLSLTNLTERGTVYEIDKIARYSNLAKESGLTVHLDGARLSNALMTLGVTPAAATWKSGVDVLTLGFTKSGALGCELIILFGGSCTKGTELMTRAKRSGHMPAKMRFLSTQANAMLNDGLWLNLANHANEMARLLSVEICKISNVALANPVHGNEVFAFISDDLAKRLWKHGVKFYRWLDGSYRFVCSWSTSLDSVTEFSDLLNKLSYD